MFSYLEDLFHTPDYHSCSTRSTRPFSVFFIYRTYPGMRLRKVPFGTVVRPEQERRLAYIIPVAKWTFNATLIRGVTSMVLCFFEMSRTVVSY
jgi:hypothetical protein